MQVARWDAEHDRLRQTAYRHVNLLSIFYESRGSARKRLPRAHAVTLVHFVVVMCAFAALFAMLVAEAVFISLDFLGTGTYFESHKLRIRNDTHFILNNGTKQTGTFSRRSHPDIVESVRLYDFAQTPYCDREGFQLTNSPFGLIVDMPADAPIELTIDKPKFAQFVDNGGKINLVISNPTKRRLKMEENWFNMGYWTNESVWRDWGSDNSVQIAKTALDSSGYYQKKCYVPSCFSQKSVLPIWNLDFTGLRKTEIWMTYNADGKVFNQQPLVFRDYAAGKVTIKAGSNVQGAFGVEHQGMLKFKVTAATIESLMVLQDQHFDLYGGVYLTLLLKADFTMYGMVGKWADAYYYRDFRLRHERTALSVSITCDEELLQNGLLLEGGGTKVKVDAQDGWTCSFSNTDAKSWTISCANASP